MVTANPDIDALFTLPLESFTAARNALAVSLRKAGKKLDAERVRRIARPPASAWAVNQVYWRRREDFDRLLALGGKARAASSSGRELRAALDARRALVAELTECAAAFLREAGHAASPNALRRITITLEVLSSAPASAEVQAGRLTADLEPLGFDDLALLLGGSATPAANVLPFDSAAHKARAAEKIAAEKRAAEKKTVEKRQAEALARERAKQAVKAAEEALKAARRKAAHAEAALAKAQAQIEALEKQKQEIEVRLARAQEVERTASGEASEAVQSVEDATRVLERARAVSNID